MDKQKTVNSLAHNDDFSKALMESYTRWTGGAGFQNSTIKEEEIPTGQKQGGTTFASFDTPIGSVPAPAEDSSTSLPTIEKQKPDDGSTKDPKATSNGGDPAIALKGSMTMGQGSMSGGVPQSQGQTLQYTNVVSKEEVEPVDESKKKAKKDYDGDGKVESGKAEYFGSKDKAIKKAMKKEDSTYGYDKKGNSLNPKDMAKAKKKKGCSEDRVQELRNEVDRILTELGEATETTYTITGEKWDTDEVLVSNEDEKAYNLEEWKKAAKKKAKKIMSYSKGGY